MSRKYFTFFLISFLSLEGASAKSIIDCRVVTGGIGECNPYGAKFLTSKKVVYDLDRQKLIRVKTLPAPEKKTFMRVISVADLIEKYVKIEDPLRFKGSEDTPLPLTVEVVENPLRKVIAEKLEAMEEIEKIEEIEAIEVCEVPPGITQDVLEDPGPQEPQIVHGKYIVVKGDVLSRIAKKFGLKTKELAKINDFKGKSTICVGQKLTVPFEQKMIDAIAAAEYKVEEGDTLISIAKKFNLEPKEVVKFNNIKSNTAVRAGKLIKLPLPYVLARIKAEKKHAARKKSGRLDLSQRFGKRKLRVTATAYSSHRGQTDKTPFLAAWNNRLRPGMKSIAVSRDLLRRYGMRNGTKVRIGGLRGYYRVRDKMNKRYRKRIDIYMGVNRRRALRWGRRSVVIYW
jgi:LysM repeat protein